MAIRQVGIDTSILLEKIKNEMYKENTVLRLISKAVGKIFVISWVFILLGTPGRQLRPVRRAKY